MLTSGTSFRWNTLGQVIAAAIVLPVLGIVAVTLRFRARAHQKSKLGVDNWLIIPALVRTSLLALRPSLTMLGGRLLCLTWELAYLLVNLSST